MRLYVGFGASNEIDILEYLSSPREGKGWNGLFIFLRSNKSAKMAVSDTFFSLQTRKRGDKAILPNGAAIGAVWKAGIVCWRHVKQRITIFHFL